MKKLFLICLAAFFSLQFANAQTTITGKVTSKNDKSPIVGAVITAKGNPNNTAISDANGLYTITVPATVKVLEATHPGMKKLSQGIGQKKIINFQMMPVNANKKGGDNGKKKDESGKKGSDTKK
jgi:TonB-dependent starch-binding outer membrane protein SusC